jgi:osmotically-inducible protein OsmY
MKGLTLTVAAIWIAAIACTRPPETEDNVKRALDDARIRNVDVAVDEGEALVHLSGTVETLADRTRAEEVAASVVGTTGRVVNDLTIEDFEDETPESPDEQLTAQLDRLIDEDRTLRERDVNLTVRDGAVTIHGEVRTTRERARATRLIEKAPAVTSVTNELRVVRQR